MQNYSRKKNIQISLIEFDFDFTGNSNDLEKSVNFKKNYS